jgi:hypothetical protein
MAGNRINLDGPDDPLDFTAAPSSVSIAVPPPPGFTHALVVVTTQDLEVGKRYRRKVTPDGREVFTEVVPESN